MGRMEARFSTSVKCFRLNCVRIAPTPLSSGYFFLTMMCLVASYQDKRLANFAWFMSLSIRLKGSQGDMGARRLPSHVLLCTGDGNDIIRKCMKKAFAGKKGPVSLIR
jgi:hypothetical protein